MLIPICFRKTLTSQLLLKALRDNEFIDNKLCYYLKPTDSFAPRFYVQPKIHQAGVPIHPTVSYIGSPLYNLNKYMADILKVYVKDGNNNIKKSSRKVSSSS